MSKFAEILTKMQASVRKVEVPYYSDSGFKYLIRFNQYPNSNGAYVAPPISICDIDPDKIEVFWSTKDQKNVFPSIDALAAHLGASFSMESVEANNE